MLSFPRNTSWSLSSSFRALDLALAITSRSFRTLVRARSTRCSAPPARAGWGATLDEHGLVWRVAALAAPYPEPAA